MKTAGIVAEFNPLHNGHEYIISETRRLTGCESVIIAMSGNYVQRGEPAIVDKWKRAEAALKAGADLIVEIPTLFCLGNSSQYASAGVALLESLSKHISICCGSESGDSDALKYLSAFIKDNREEIEAIIKTRIKDGLSYPSSREAAVLSLMSTQKLSDKYINKAGNLLSKSNDILALEYLMAANNSEIFFIKRKGAGYDDSFSKDCEFQSAGAIRSLIYEKGLDEALDMLDSFMPKHSKEMIAGCELCFNSAFSDILRYAVMQMDEKEIEDCPSGGEGLGYLVKEAVLNCDSWDEIVMRCKSKRYTYSRISRLCMQIVLHISRSEYSIADPLYIRVLGASDKGRQLLSHIKKNDMASLPIITNINKDREKLSPEALKMLELDVKSSDVYNLVLERNTHIYSDHRMKPIII